MEDKIEIIYYQMLEIENRLDKKIEYLQQAEKNLEKIALQIESFLKRMERQNVR